MSKIKKFLCTQTVLAVSLLCALISMIIIPPSGKYLSYINFSTLILLFCLMAAVAGFNNTGIFVKISSFLTSKCHSARLLTFILMNVCFFSSMLITNDVALITFVPVTTALFSSAGINKKNNLIFAVIIETAAANLGSMMTPIGNPQNIFICSNYQLYPSDFIKIMLPYGIISYIILSAMTFLIKNEKIEPIKNISKNPLPKIKILMYSAVFIICILTVSGFINEYICLALCCFIIAAADFKIFAKVDYALLATFVCFFIFSGNIGNIEKIQVFISSVINGNEIISSALISQIISNVPSAVLLSGFTQNAGKLLVGVNIGGLGTPIASLASLISYKYYTKSENARNGKYMTFFIITGFIMLIIMIGFSFIINLIFKR